MIPLSNFLRINRKRRGLTQEEVAFLLGVKGESRAIKVSRDENSVREASLRAAVAYELIYGKLVSHLFAGLRREIVRDVKIRAKVLLHRRGKQNPKRLAALTKLVSELST